MCFFSTAVRVTGLLAFATAFEGALDPDAGAFGLLKEVVVDGLDEEGIVFEEPVATSSDAEAEL